MLSFDRLDTCEGCLGPRHADLASSCRLCDLLPPEDRQRRAALFKANIEECLSVAGDCSLDDAIDFFAAGSHCESDGFYRIGDVSSLAAHSLPESIVGDKRMSLRRWQPPPKRCLMAEDAHASPQRMSAHISSDVSPQPSSGTETLTWLASVKDMKQHKNACPLPEHYAEWQRACSLNFWMSRLISKGYTLQFAAQPPLFRGSPKTNSSILPSTCFVGTLTWDIENTIRLAQASEPDPGSGPPGRRFIPKSVIGKVLDWASFGHTLSLKPDGPPQYWTPLEALFSNLSLHLNYNPHQEPFKEGNSFLVLDEQRFAKEILPKFFKHNNMASFIRQLNMYGFRKVMHIDTGIVKQERDGPVEFQHPYFKHGQDDLLENIKRKVSNARPEDNKVRNEDLSKILASVQSVHSKQENINLRLTTLKRENEALWREISDLRQKHTHQQQLIKKLIHFIITLVKSKHVLNLKRKSRSILMNSNGKKPKYIHEIYDEKSCVDQMSVNSLNGVKDAEISDDVVICDLTRSDADGTADITHRSPRAHEQGDVEIVELELEDCEVLSADTEVSTSCTDDDDVKHTEKSAADNNLKRITSDGYDPTTCGPTSGPTSSALQLNKPSSLNLEDPVKIMDSILNDNGAISQNINLLGKVELMDYLDSIDCSLEDFQAMLYEKQFGVDFDTHEGSISARENMNQPIKGRQKNDNTDKQLIQYTSCPLLAFLDGHALPSELDLGATGTESTDLSHPQLFSHSGVSVDPVPPSELLDSSLESKQPLRSSLIRLEPLTEAEASEETLFYLCELSPAGSDPAEENENLVDHRLSPVQVL
ncbi:heat shock factor protein 2 [Nematolebias whitei]|uniref:heat shock factor protein 2 n=1 Tax=Nematolebias whitei TaxID=451745 RepID=UPI00189C0CC7|nr:heat shock factor protein 2 [Nematolebias whitei]